MIVLNIDGVVADLGSELEHAFNSASVVDEAGGFRWRDIFCHVSDRDFEIVFSDPLTYKNAKPFEDAWYWINHHSAQYDIMYVTSRDSSLNRITWEWFVDWDIPADFVVFEGDKAYFIPQLEVSVYVDDHPDIVKYLRYHGIKAYVLNRSYNLHYEIDEAFRINSLWEIDL